MQIHLSESTKIKVNLYQLCESTKVKENLEKDSDINYNTRIK